MGASSCSSSGWVRRSPVAAGGCWAGAGATVCAGSAKAERAGHSNAVVSPKVTATEVASARCQLEIPAT